MITPSNQKGFSLIYLIFIIVALAGMGAAIYSFTTSTTYTELTENNRNRAYQLAVAGMNYAAQQYYAGVDLSDNQFLNNGNPYTLANSRGKITYSVSVVTGSFISYYNVVSTGTVNDSDGLLLAKAQVRSGSQPGMPNYFPYSPPVDQTVMKNTMNDLSGFRSEDLKDSANHSMIQIAAYVATGGTHIYWAAFINQGTYPRTDGDNPGCTMGFHTARIHENYANELRHSWETYYHVNYDTQVKVGWYKDLQAAVSGLNFRWHETAHNSGLFQGYGLAFMRYTYNPSGSAPDCGGDYDYIPNSIKPPGLAGKLLLVLWEQRVEGGVEKRRWLAYAELGTPDPNPAARAGNDPKVVGAQDGVDGLLNDDALVMVRIKENFIGGQRVNEINVFYGDASPYYDGVRTPNSVATDITRKRMFPEWIRTDLFPTWPTKKFGLFNYTDGGTDYAINNFWVYSDPTYYDFFTLVSASDKIGPEPPATTPVGNPVQWIINTAYKDTRSDTSSVPADTNLVTLLTYDSGNGKWYDKATLRTYKFVLDDFSPHNMEVGLHAMGNLNNDDRVVAFDDFALQILGR